MTFVVFERPTIIPCKGDLEKLRRGKMAIAPDAAAKGLMTEGSPSSRRCAKVASIVYESSMSNFSCVAEEHEIARNKIFWHTQMQGIYGALKAITSLTMYAAKVIQ
jgi:hypothetical protein